MQTHTIVLGQYRDALSIPNTARPMMGYLVLPCTFSLFHGVIQKEIYENGIDLCARVIFGNLSPDELNAPDAAA
jgi:hypothetical protein